MKLEVFDDRRSWIHFVVGVVSYFHTFPASSVHCLSVGGVHRQEGVKGEPDRRLHGADLWLLPHVCDGVVVE